MSTSGLITYSRLLRIPATHLRGTYATLASDPSPSNPRHLKCKYPFPTHKNPTPHQIFHLSPSASRAEIKARYYELVKIHHPDVNTSQDESSSLTRHQRFQSITAAYNVLRGHGRPSKWNATPTSHSFEEEILRRASSTPSGRTWTGKRNQWGGFVYENEGPQLNTKGPRERVFAREDTMFWFVGIFALGGAILHFVSFSPSIEAAKSHATAKQYLDEARKARDEYGVQRRIAVKQWAEEQRAQQGFQQEDLKYDEDEYGPDAVSLIKAGEPHPVRTTDVPSSPSRPN